MQEDGDSVPEPGRWPVGPQTDSQISKDRIWIDGCFDFAHHGHAGAMLQARRLGTELVVGIHSDEEILRHKGPSVMTLRERVAAVDACRWSSKVIPNAPYVTSLPWISHYGCYFVVHGDDITSDSNGEDCYRYVKEAKRFLIVRRTPSISTTDLVGRMLLCTKAHFIRSLPEALSMTAKGDMTAESKSVGTAMKQRISDYAADATGTQPGCTVFLWKSSPVNTEQDNPVEDGSCESIVSGVEPQSDQRLIYVDGDFDLFSSGHIEFLRQVTLAEAEIGRRKGWPEDCTKTYPPAYIIAGVHEDSVINHWKGLNYPIMNIFERGLCVLQCRFVHSVVFSAPFSPSSNFLSKLPFGRPHGVYHGPTSNVPVTCDPYADARNLDIYCEIGNHEYQDVNAEQIVQRILRSRKLYESRQALKSTKAQMEQALA